MPEPIEDDRDDDLNDDDAKRLLDDDDDTGTDDESRKRPDAGDPSALGDAGKKALDAMKRERNMARKELNDLRGKLKSHEDSNKTDLQRLQEARDEAAGRAAKAEERAKSLQIAMDRAPAHATLRQVQAVAKRVRGDDDDDLAADADELFELLAPAPKETPEKPEKKVATRPKERLRGGGDPEDEPEETDPRKLAEAIRRRR